MTASPHRDGPNGWFFAPYKPDPVMSRTLRGWILLVSGGFFVLFGLVAVGLAPFGDVGGLIALPVFGVPMLALAAGAVFDGYAMLKEQRISLLGRLAVLMATLLVVAAWLPLGVLVVKPLVAADHASTDNTATTSSAVDDEISDGPNAAPETGPIEIVGAAQIQVLMNGSILLNGQEVSLERLHSSMELFKTAGAGETTIYTEVEGSTLAPQGRNVLNMLLNLEIPFSMTGSPDFPAAE